MSDLRRFAGNRGALLLAPVAVVVLVLVGMSLRPASAPASDANIAPYTPSPTPSRVIYPTVAIIGDSYTQGSRMGGNDAANYSRTLAEALKWNVQTFAMGRSGYINGQDAKPPVNFATHAAVVVAAKPDGVIIFGGVNDRYFAPAAITKAVTDLLASLRERLPDATLIVVGPAWPAGVKQDPGPTRDAIKAAAKAAHAKFVDPIAEGWFTGTSAKLIGVDTVHPTDAGHAYMAKQLIADLRGKIARR